MNNRKGETEWIVKGSYADLTIQYVKRVWKGEFGHSLNMPEYPDKDKQLSLPEIKAKCMEEVTKITQILCKRGFSSTASIEQCIVPLLQTTEKILLESNKKGSLKEKNLEEIRALVETIPKQFLSHFF